MFVFSLSNQRLETW